MLLFKTALQTTPSTQVKLYKISYWKDEARDLSSREQISLNVRFVEYSNARTNVVREEFLGFVQAASAAGEALAGTFLEALRNYDVDVNKMRGQVYDGASNMRGNNTSHLMYSCSSIIVFTYKVHIIIQSTNIILPVYTIMFQENIEEFKQE